MFVEIHDLIIDYLYTLVFQKLLHQVGSIKMMLPRKQSCFIYNPMCRYFWHTTSSVHGPSDHSGTTGGTEIFGNGTIRGHPALGNLPGHLIDFLEEVFVFGIHFKYRFKYQNQTQSRLSPALTTGFKGHIRAAVNKIS